MCEDKSGNRTAHFRHCILCPKLLVEEMTGPELVRHNGAHILHDTKLKAADNPCGFCLNAGTSCVIHIQKKPDGTYRIDKTLSQCPNLRTLSLKVAGQYTLKSPCTNVPLPCPLCSKSAPSVWKYNLRAHILTNHPSANAELPEYRKLYEISADERILMKAILLRPIRKPRKKKGKDAGSLKVSNLHSACSAFQ